MKRKLCFDDTLLNGLYFGLIISQINCREHRLLNLTKKVLEQCAKLLIEKHYYNYYTLIFINQILNRVGKCRQTYNTHADFGTQKNNLTWSCSEF